jgi:hypothetical protein
MLPKPVIGTDTVRTTAPTAAVMMAMVVVPALLWLAGLWQTVVYTTSAPVRTVTQYAY